MLTARRSGLHLPKPSPIPTWYCRTSLVSYEPSRLVRRRLETMIMGNARSRVVVGIERQRPVNETHAWSPLSSTLAVHSICVDSYRR